MKTTTEGDYLTSDHVTFTVSRPAWEPVMLAHLRTGGDAEHRRLYDLCVTELIAAGKTAEELARDAVQSVAGRHRSLLDDALYIADSPSARQSARDVAVPRYPNFHWPVIPEMPDPRSLFRNINVC